MLGAQDVRLVVDVRAIPRSRTNPQYNSQDFSEALSEVQVGYQHIAALGGLRGRMAGVPKEANALWKNESFHNYADYATSKEFRSGLETLREWGHTTTCAIMCSEAVWWRCHRRIIADYLIAAGEIVFHILGPQALSKAKLTDGARVGPGATVLYPPPAGESDKHLATKR